MTNGHSLHMSPEQLAAHQARVKGRTVDLGSGGEEKRGKGNKFGAVKKTVNGIEFDSTREAERYILLRLQEKDGLISDLKVHRPMQVYVNGQHVFSYEVDFSYVRTPMSHHTYEDVKGYRKGSAYQLFRLKKAIVLAVLGIEIDEV